MNTDRHHVNSDNISYRFYHISYDTTWGIITSLSDYYNKNDLDSVPLFFKLLDLV